MSARRWTRTHGIPGIDVCSEVCKRHHRFVLPFHRRHVDGRVQLLRPTTAAHRDAQPIDTVHRTRRTLFVQSTSAPRLTSSRMTETWPLPAARCSGVWSFCHNIITYVMSCPQPCVGSAHARTRALFRASMLAPARTSSRTTDKCPHIAATWMGVSPFCASTATGTSSPTRQG